jgi:hypothetical protein
MERSASLRISFFEHHEKDIKGKISILPQMGNKTNGLKLVIDPSQFNFCFKNFFSFLISFLIFAIITTMFLDLSQLYYRRPSLFAVLVSAVLTIRGLLFDTRFCYPRTFPSLIRGLWQKNVKFCQILKSKLQF